MKKTLAIFIMVGSSLVGLSKINAQTAPSGTLAANPQNVTAFTNENGSGNTKLSWSTANSPRKLISLTKTRKDGSLVAAESVVVDINELSFSRDLHYIQKDIIHTFKLYSATGTSKADYVKGALLATYIVNGYDPDVK